MQFVVLSEGVHLGSCSVLKLGVDRNVGLDKEGLVMVMYVGMGLVQVWLAKEYRCCSG